MKVNLTKVKAVLERDTFNAPGQREVTATWTGKYPCLCSGEWIITVDGEPVDIPEELKRSPMNTKKLYFAWSFDESFHEQWEDYEAGLDYKDWIQEKKDWLQDLHLSSVETHALYRAINESDWRHGSCGGCI